MGSIYYHGAHNEVDSLLGWLNEAKEGKTRIVVMSETDDNYHWRESIEKSFGEKFEECCDGLSFNYMYPEEDPEMFSGFSKRLLDGEFLAFELFLIDLVNPEIEQLQKGMDFIKFISKVDTKCFVILKTFARFSDHSDYASVLNELAKLDCVRYMEPGPPSGKEEILALGKQVSEMSFYFSGDWYDMHYDAYLLKNAYELMEPYAADNYEIYNKLIEDMQCYYSAEHEFDKFRELILRQLSLYEGKLTAWKKGRLLEHAAKMFAKMWDFDSAERYYQKNLLNTFYKSESWHVYFSVHNEYRDMAKYYMSVYEMDKALACYNKALYYINFDSPKFASSVYQERSKLLAKLGRYSEALEDCEASISLMDEDDKFNNCGIYDYFDAKYNVYKMSGNQEAMAELAEQLLSLEEECDNSQDLEFYRFAAESCEAVGNLKNASEMHQLEVTCAEIRLDFPHSPYEWVSALESALIFYYRHGFVDQAGEYKAELFDVISDANPEHYSMKKSMAKVYYGLGQFSRATSTYLSWIDEKLNVEDFMQDQVMKLYYEVAVMLLSNRDNWFKVFENNGKKQELVRHAIDLLEKHINMVINCWSSTFSHWPLSRLIHIFFEIGEYDKAISLIARVKGLCNDLEKYNESYCNDETAIANLYLSSICIKQGNKLQGETFLKFAKANYAKAKRDREVLKLHFAYYYFELGNYDEAMRYYKRIENPEYLRMHSELGIQRYVDDAVRKMDPKTK